VIGLTAEYTAERNELYTKNDFEEYYPLSQKIMRAAGEAIRDYNMIRSNDRILIGLSGGKDSLLLSLALAAFRKRSPVKFKLSACFIDQSNGQVETQQFKAFTNTLDIPLEVIKHPTYKIIEDRAERSPCSFCANMRRGIMASKAKEMDCNVIALGHHKDDTVETVLLNLFYGGRFKCYHPHMLMTHTGVRVIRPFIYIEENKISLEAKRLKLPITSSCCPYENRAKRKIAKDMLAELGKAAPDIKSNIIHALQNTSYKDVWHEKTLNE